MFLLMFLCSYKVDISGNSWRYSLHRTPVKLNCYLRVLAITLLRNIEMPPKIGDIVISYRFIPGLKADSDLKTVLFGTLT